MTVTLTSIGNIGYTLRAEPGGDGGVTLWFVPPPERRDFDDELAILLTVVEARAFLDELALVLDELP